MKLKMLLDCCEVETIEQLVARCSELEFALNEQIALNEQLVLDNQKLVSKKRSIPLQPTTKRSRQKQKGHVSLLEQTRKYLDKKFYGE